MPHPSNTEYYVCITSQREGDAILFTHEGGVDIGDVDAKALTLNLPVPKEQRSRALGVVFEADPNDTTTLPDNVIGERRLTPLETLVLVKACSQAIVNHGGVLLLIYAHDPCNDCSLHIQASRPLASCTRFGILLPLKCSVGSFRSSYSPWLPKAP